MDSRATQSHVHDDYNEHRHHNDVGSQQVTHGTEEHHGEHEKKSVLKKVKAKAKKIKDTLTKHGHHDNEHGHEHNYEHQHIPDDHDLDEEDDEDEDEELVQDPEVHGAPIYDSAAVRHFTPGQVRTSGPGVSFGNTTVMGEPHHEPRGVAVSPSSQVAQSRATDPTRTFVGEGNGVQSKVNLERPMELQEDPHAPGRRTGAYDSANYQTKVTDPSGTGGAEIDITPVQKSLDRMTIHNEQNPSTQPNILPTIPETQQPSIGIHHQFSPELSTATKTPYPSSTLSHNQKLPELSGEVKTQYPKSHDQFTTQTQHPYHDQNLSEMSSGHSQFIPVLSTEHQPHHPSTTSHDHQYSPQHSSVAKTQHPFATSHDQNLPQYSPNVTTTQHLFATSHDQNLPQYSPNVTKTQHPFATSHDQFTPEFSPEPNPHHPFATSHDQHLPQHSTALKPQYPSATSHDSFSPQLPTEHKPQHTSFTSHDQNFPQHSTALKPQYPSATSHDNFSLQLPNEPRHQHTSFTSHDQNLPQHSSGTNTQYPSTGSHNKFSPLLPNEPRHQHTSATIHDQVLPQHSSATKTEYPLSHDQNMSQISSATTRTQYPSAGSHDQFKPELPTEYPSATSHQQHSISHDQFTPEQPQPNHPSLDKQYNQTNSYADKISLATVAIADKAITAKNAVTSKLGYGGENVETQNSKPSNQNQSSYTEKISSATSAIADKAVSAKNTVASKLGFGGGGAAENISSSHSSSSSTSATEYGKKIGDSLTEKLAPVYERVGGVGNEKSGVVGGVGSEKSGGVEQDKGVSMKDYLAEKLRPGEDERALSEVIAESLYKKGGEEEEKGVEIGEERRDVRKLVSDAVHKRGDDNEERRDVRRGKVTESEEVKRRLGSCDDEIDKEEGEKSVADKFKDVVGSWFGSSGDNNNQSTTQGGGDLSKNSGVEVKRGDHGLMGHDSSD